MTVTNNARTIGGAAAHRVRAAYQRITDLDRPEIWITLASEADSLAAAAVVDERVARGETLPLAGLVAAVKDNIDVAGLPTTAGAESYRYQPGVDATAAERMRAAGAVIIGKTNLDQFATGLVGTRSPFGPVRNAWDPERISGGSSSGSAVAVALGIVDVALGTDTAGSGRVPAALNGIVGVKPTRGLIPTTGVVPACRSIDCVTVFARELGLARRAVELLSGPDGRDPLARTDRAAGVLPPRPRIAIPTTDHLEGLAEGWADAFRAAAGRLAASGVQVVEVDIAPLLTAAKLLYEGAFVAERYSGVGAHIEANRALIGSDLDPSVAAIVLGGTGTSASDYYDDRERLDHLALESDALLDGCDALLTPTTTWHPTLAEVAADPIAANSRMGRFTNFANLLDMSSLAVPAGFVDGLPFGVMLTGGAFRDRLLAQLAAAMAEPSIDLFVVGAHLSGQPLNRQLVSAGGSFRSAACTTDSYRLFALDTAPAKPGLVRSPSGGGPIAGEVWRLPASGFGTFVASLPAPMTIGSVQLADGATVSGFLCEPIAIDGAREITEHGGWRAWLAVTSPAVPATP